MKATENKTAVYENGTASKLSSIEGLRQFFINDLQDIYWSEKALLKVIPSMIINASSEELMEALNDYLEETYEHVTRLEDIFTGVELKAGAKKCAVMEALIKEAEQIMEETEKGVTRDAGIIAAAQKIAHYKIASYGTLGAYAEIIGYEDAVNLLHQSLEEERAADIKLTEVIAAALMQEEMLD